MAVCELSGFVSVESKMQCSCIFSETDLLLYNITRLREGKGKNELFPMSTLTSSELFVFALLFSERNLQFIYRRTIL